MNGHYIHWFPCRAGCVYELNLIRSVVAIFFSERWFGTCHNNVLPVCGHSVLQVASGLLLVWSSDPAASMCFYLANFIFRTGKKLASCCSKF